MILNLKYLYKENYSKVKVIKTICPYINLFIWNNNLQYYVLFLFVNSSAKEFLQKYKFDFYQTIGFIGNLNVSK